MERIVVLVTAAEKQKIKKAAGLASVSAWLRHVALCECNGERAEKRKVKEKTK